MAVTLGTGGHIMVVTNYCYLVISAVPMMMTMMMILIRMLLMSLMSCNGQLVSVLGTLLLISD